MTQSVAFLFAIIKEYFATDTVLRKSVIVYIDLLAKAFDMGALGLNGTH